MLVPQVPVLLSKLVYLPPCHTSDRTLHKKWAGRSLFCKDPVVRLEQVIFSEPQCSHLYKIGISFLLF